MMSCFCGKHNLFYKFLPCSIKRGILFIIILFLVFVSLHNASPSTIIGRLVKNEGIQTRQLRYKIYLFRVFPVGEAVFRNDGVEEHKGEKVYHLSATATSLRFLSVFFNGYAAMDSYIDMQQFNPVLFSQKIVVTDRKYDYKEVSYDQKNHIMSIQGIRRQIFPNTQDPLSALFNVRRMDFEKTNDFEMDINTNQKNYILKAIAQSKDISVYKKMHKTAFLKADISRRDKNPYRKSKISMVLLEEGGNIPILIDVFTRGLFINARLIDTK